MTRRSNSFSGRITQGRREKTPESGRKGSLDGRRTRPAKRSKASEIGAPTPSSAPSSEGCRLLREVDGSHAAVAERVGVSKAMVGFWRAGQARPALASRLRIERIYDIAASAWDVAPGAAVPTEPPTPVRAGRTLEMVNAEISALQGMLVVSLTAPLRLKLSDGLAKFLALRARLEREEELLEDRIVREHPEWRRLTSTIVEVLRPFPEAARAVAEALVRLDAEAAA